MLGPVAPRKASLCIFSRRAFSFSSLWGRTVPLVGFSAHVWTVKAVHMHVWASPCMWCSGVEATRRGCRQNAKTAFLSLAQLWNLRCLTLPFPCSFPLSQWNPLSYHWKHSHCCPGAVHIYSRQLGRAEMLLQRSRLKAAGAAHSVPGSQPSWPWRAQCLLIVIYWSLQILKAASIQSYPLSSC